VSYCAIHFALDSCNNLAIAWLSNRLFGDVCRGLKQGDERANRFGRTMTMPDDLAALHARHATARERSIASAALF
jgi:hypothetical protein